MMQTCLVHPVLFHMTFGITEEPSNNALDVQGFPKSALLASLLDLKFNSIWLESGGLNTVALKSKTQRQVTSTIAKPKIQRQITEHSNILREQAIDKDRRWLKGRTHRPSLFKNLSLTFIWKKKKKTWTVHSFSRPWFLAVACSYFFPHKLTLLWFLICRCTFGFAVGLRVLLLHFALQGHRS